MDYLLSVNGYQGETVDCEVKALGRTVAIRAQVVLLVISLHDLDGLEVARRLREIHETRPSHLIALFERSEDPERSRMADSGHDLMKLMTNAALRSIPD